MTLLALPRYGRLGASSRLRMLQYLPGLKGRAVTAEVQPFFDDRYLARLYSGEKSLISAAGAHARRLTDLGRLRHADAIWIEKEALPRLPWGIERRLLPRHCPIVTDFDDAVFHSYDLHRSGLVRRLLGRKIDRLMAASALVTAGNAYLAERARRAGAPRVEIVPTVVDIEAYAVRPYTAPARDARIGWIGTASTWAAYMAPMMPLLSEVAAAQGARITAVGPGRAAEPHGLLDILDWSEATEVARIQQMDIGLMPLTDTAWARGKCGYKLIQYMACGLPVVASPVGVNAEIVEHGVNGFLAATDAEWRDALTTLLRDPALRQRMGEAGRCKIEEHYSLQVWVPKLADMLRQVAETRGHTPGQTTATTP